MPVTAWDNFARISRLESMPMPEPTISIDFQPMYMDNIAELGVAEPEFEDALNGVTPSVDCMDQVEQSGVNWDERIWTTRY